MVQRARELAAHGAQDAPGEKDDTADQQEQPGPQRRDGQQQGDHGGGSDQHDAERGERAIIDEHAEDFVDNGAEQVPAPTVNTAEEVIALSEPQRLAVLFRAIRAAGLECQQVTSAERVPGGAAPRWRADCVTGDQYLVDVGPNGTAYVTSPVRR